MRPLVLVASLVASTSIAAADPEPAATASTSLPAVAIAVNAPFMWPLTKSVGVSGYVAIHAHQSVRINVASYDYLHLSEVLADGEGAPHGRTTDVGVSWQYFPRSVWNGFVVELGVMRRAQDTRDYDEDEVPTITDTNATGYAARAMLGWSWLGWDRVFVAAAAGGSIGRYTGTETTVDDYFDQMWVTRDFARLEGSLEAYLRFGVALGL